MDVLCILAGTIRSPSAHGAYWIACTYICTNTDALGIGMQYFVAVSIAIENFDRAVLSANKRDLTGDGGMHGWVGQIDSRLASHIIEVNAAMWTTGTSFTVLSSYMCVDTIARR